MPDKHLSPIDWFRDAAPYIHAHRGKTFVIFISGQSVEHANFTRLLRDITLLHSLDIKTVIVHGARAQIDQKLKSCNIRPQIINGQRITDDECLDIVKQTVSDIRLKIEAALSIGLGSRQASGFKANVASGNFIKAQPVGVLDGVDYIHTGKIRSVAGNKIKTLLQQNSIVLLSSLGFAASGDIFNLNAEDVATDTAISLKADKLIFLGTEYEPLAFKTNKGFLTTQSAGKLLRQNLLDENSSRNLKSAVKACEQGISRVHLLNSTLDGILLQELFTPNGIGTLITDEPYEKIREATKSDLGKIYSLLKPLQTKGILRAKSENEFKDDLDNFYVLEQDEKIIGVVALYIYDNNMAEISSIAVDEQYQRLGYGEKLLKFAELSAKIAEIDKLFLLSTQTSHWFMEHGFNQAKISELPQKKKQSLDFDRNSKAYFKTL